ncbi:MAG TPA: PEP-CTERM sorting domain-containing protein [Lacipirellulaceae bacterium]
MLSKRLGALGGLMLVLAAAWIGPQSAAASEITWNAPIIVQSPTDINLPTGGTVHFAADFNTPTDFGPEDDVINGITFAPVGAAGISGLLTHTFSSGPNFGAAAFPGGTGDADLDNLLNSHSWMGGDPGTASVTLQGLTVGAPYQIQVIGAVDTRPCCAARTYEPDNGQGSFNTGTSIQRGLVQSILGTFIADAGTQVFQWRSLNNAAGNNDPGMSGLVVTRMPGSIGGVVAATLDRDTGNLSVSNGTTQPFDIIGYTVQSNFGGLNPANWQSVANNYDKPSAPTPGDGSIDSNDAWRMLSDSASRTNLSEAELNTSGPRDGGAIGAGQTLDLGNVWLKSPTEDVILEVLRSDGRIHTVGLTFAGNGDQAFAFADLNFDNLLTPADWTIYISNAQSDLSGFSAAERYQRGDLNNDGVNNLNDMKLFLDAYDAANGAGSAALLASVPEPSTCMLIVLGVAALTGRRFRGRLSQRHAAGGLLAVLALAVSAPQSAHAAEISWETPFTVNDNSDVIVPAGSTVLFAADFNDAAGFAPDDGIINGVAFTRVDAAGIPGLLTHTFASGPNNGAAGYTATAPPGMDMDLVELLDSHSWHPGNPATAMVTIDGLTAGVPYQIQVIGAVDTRGCCSARIYEPDDGIGNFDTGVSYARGDVASVIGAFTADATTQTFQWRSQNNAAGNNDPSMSGLVVVQLPGAFTLDLEVNTVSGHVTIKNVTENLDFNVRGYEVTSPAGSLSTTGWTVPAGWDKAGGASAFALEAGSLAASSLLMPGQSLSLGQAYNTTLGAEDLEFRFLSADGGLRSGSVSYVTAPGGVAGDYNGNGTVDAADYVIWRKTLNTNTTLPNDDTPGTVTQEDYTVWRTNFGRTGGSGADLGNSAAVPEPNAAMLVLLAVAVGVCYRLPAARRFALVRCPALPVLVSGLIGLAIGHAAHANAYVDRTYLFGDDSSEGAANGAVVGSGNTFGVTFDSANAPGSGDLQDLSPFGGPTYINVTTTGANLSQARPGAAADGSVLGILFDGGDDYLRGARLNNPATSDASIGSIVQPPGPLDYIGISDRGFQLWVYPRGPNPGTVQNVVSDLNQHGLRINAAGQWVMRYNGADVNSNRAVAFNEWAHLMVVRPTAAAPTGGSIMFLNGEAIAAAPGGYNGAPTPNEFLVVGSEPADATGNSDMEFFRGVLDDMNMFVMGTVTNGPNPAPGTYTFDLTADNKYVANSALSGITGVPGDVNQDGSVGAADIDALVAGWFNEKRLNNVRVGDVQTLRDGDLNLDGVTNLADVFLLHDALLAGTGSGFDFSRLPGGSVPEPSTLALSVLLLGLWRGRRPRR